MKKILTTAIAIALTISMTIVGFVLTSYAGNNDGIDTTAPIDTAAPANVDTHEHRWELMMVNSDAQNHQKVCVLCQTVVGENHVFFGNTCGICGYTVSTDSHECLIIEANTNYHKYSCEICENNQRVYHNVEAMTVLAKNAFFHTWECEGCGYEYAEEHNFAIVFDASTHHEVCEDCGYVQPAVAHGMVNYFYGNYHDIGCDYCGFTEAHHVGVSYVTIDSNSCQATCSCGVTEVIPHDWDGFRCEGCGYMMSGNTYAIVKRISKNDEGSYTVRFMVNGETHRVEMEDIGNIETDDFVKIRHDGNAIFDITVMVDGDIIHEEENFRNYIISDEIAEKAGNLVFDDLVIEEITYHGEDLISINFESGTRSIGFKADGYVVYDMMDGAMGELEENFAYLTFSAGDMLYFICFW